MHKEKAAIFVFASMIMSIFCPQSTFALSEDMADQFLELLTDGESDEQLKSESVQASAVQESALNAHKESFLQRSIKEIKIIGNVRTPTPAILSHIPYHIGELFDPSKTRMLIHNLYQLGRFRTVDVYGQIVDDANMILYVAVQEKQPVKDVFFTGNHALSESDMRKKIDFEFPAADAEELTAYAKRIKKLYGERGYTNVCVDTKVSIESDDRAVVTFNIQEGTKSLVKKICFTGNRAVTGKELRKAIFTQEDWLLGFLSSAGVYIPERLEGDKYQIEQFYQNRGFLQAHVVNTEIDINEKAGCVNLLFDIEEGSRYVISDVQVDGKGILPDEYLKALLPIKTGDFYSREMIIQTLKGLEALWGNVGHLFAHVEPAVIPDDEKKTVSLSFIADPGEKVLLNRVNIRGNNKTRDHVIRRQLLVQEGSVLTTAQMDASKQSVESLGYFEARDGVNWKINRMGKDLVDLDLILKEGKTGNLNVQASYGGNGSTLSSPTTGVAVKGILSDVNFLGTGLNYSLEGSWSYEEQTIIAHLAQQWLFEKPLAGSFDLYHRRPTYDDLHLITPQPINGKVTGCGGSIGFITPPQYGALGNVNIVGGFGIDRLAYERHPLANTRNELINREYQTILNQEFSPGKYVWFSQALEQNFVNHPIHPSHGYKWRAFSKIAAPIVGDRLAFYKCEFDAHWFTPLVEQYNLVFHLHGFLGAALPIGNRLVPYGELYHIGGQSSVRGYLYGQISPLFLGDSIGAKKSFFFNAEMIAPITPNMDIKGVLFWDGGAGWDNPYVNQTNSLYVVNNSIDYRQSMGVGVRILNPMPVRIDYGFKWDPRKGETASEVHFSMNYSW